MHSKTKAFRPRRSVLYMPGANPRAMEKARGLPADGLILDLEDAVAPNSKIDARNAVIANVRVGGFGQREVVIRINGADTEWFKDDLAAAAHSGADAILVPKISSANAMLWTAQALEALDPPKDLVLWAMMETPGAMLEAGAIAGATPRLAVMVMGTNDLLKDLNGRAVANRAPLLTSLGLCLLAARAHGLGILDGVYNQIQDLDGFQAECVTARDMGFDGKTLIHPTQIDGANSAFAPARAEIDGAKRIIAAFDAAQADGRGVVQLEGRMIEALHVEQARAVIDLAQAIGSIP